MDIAEFLLARIAEDEAVARSAIDPDRPGVHWRWTSPEDSDEPAAARWLRTAEEFPTTSGVGPLPAFPLGYEFVAEPTRAMDHIARHDPARVLAECEAKRRIVEFHAGWPVLAEIEPTFDRDDTRPDSMVFKMSRQIAWATEREYRNRFGAEPPTAPMLRALAAVYADDPAYQQEWAL